LQGEKQAVLRWTATSEMAGGHYAVERSTDGLAFVEIGRVVPAGDNPKAQSYELRDAQPLMQQTYYRLRLVGADQSTKTSALALVSPAARESGQVSVYPNPTSGTAPTHLALRGLAGRNLTVFVRDVLGRTVASQQLAPAAYLADVTLTLPPTATAGLYVVSITDGTQTWTTRWTLEP